MSVVIADPSSHTDGFGSNDFIVTVFRKTIAELPTAVSPGTPILIRGIKVRPRTTDFGLALRCGFRSPYGMTSRKVKLLPLAAGCRARIPGRPCLVGRR
jgi:hypothetical protein